MTVLVASALTGAGLATVAWLAVALPAGAQTGPTLTGIAPAAGPTSGGTAVTLFGQDLSGATAVEFGGTPGTDVSVSAAGTMVTVTSPPSISDGISVTVVTPSGTSNGEPFLFTAGGAPTVASVAPTDVLVSGGALVTVTGTGFGQDNIADQLYPDVSSVQVGGTSVLAVAAWPTTAPPWAPFALVESATQLVLLVPPAASSGPMDVTVTTSYGTSSTSAADQLTYAPLSCRQQLSSSDDLCVEAAAGTIDLDSLGTEFTSFSLPGATMLGTVDTGTGAVELPASQVAWAPAPTTTAPPFVLVDQLQLYDDGALTGTYDTSSGALSLQGTLEVACVGGASIIEVGPVLAFSTPLTLAGTLGPVIPVPSDPTVAEATGVLTGTTAYGYGGDPTSTLALSLPVTVYAGSPYPPPPTVSGVFPFWGPVSGYSLSWVFGGSFSDVTGVTFGNQAALFKVFNVESAAGPVTAGVVPRHRRRLVTSVTGTSDVSAADHFAYQQPASTAPG